MLSKFLRSKRKLLTQSFVIDLNDTARKGGSTRYDLSHDLSVPICREAIYTVRFVVQLDFSSRGPDLGNIRRVWYFTGFDTRLGSDWLNWRYSVNVVIKVSSLQIDTRPFAAAHMKWSRYNLLERVNVKSGCDMSGSHFGSDKSCDKSHRVEPHNNLQHQRWKRTRLPRE